MIITSWLKMLISEINPLSLIVDRKKTPNNLQIYNAVLFVKNKFVVSNDEQNKFLITIFDLCIKILIFQLVICH